MRDPKIPLAWAAFYKKPADTFSIGEISAVEYEFALPEFRTEITKREYIENINDIKKLIADGETYQVNYTFRIKGSAIEYPERLFVNLLSYHKAEYAAFFNTGGLKVLSLSPELIILKRGNITYSHPMKGTSARFPDCERDKGAVLFLSKDEKNRAENLMITDMARNDLGKISLPGSVKASSLFKVITLPSLHQMISVVRGRIREKVSIYEIFKAMFPAASITGAPKIRTCEIIADAEKSPRGIYTGSAGSVSPGGDFIFNVAIRTVLCSKNNAAAGIGGGIVADSNAGSEWEEALLKSSFLKRRPDKFKIFETMLWEKNKGAYLWLDEHIRRLRNSQKYFLRPFREKIIRKYLAGLARKLPDAARVKVSVDEKGICETEWSVVPEKGWRKRNLKIAVSNVRTLSEDVFLYHKTSMRTLYDSEFKKAKSLGFDEIIFANEKNEVTEGAITNLFVKRKNAWITPPVSCGLLPGIWREKMILIFGAKEQVITVEELMNEKNIIIGNSFRGEGVISEIKK
jgi:para-aminobenzoate synthetase/4-amino-4-deoxychorismate lyase